jgi:hypothetical protein
MLFLATWMQSVLVLRSFGEEREPIAHFLPRGRQPRLPEELQREKTDTPSKIESTALTEEIRSAQDLRQNSQKLAF